MKILFTKKIDISKISQTLGESFEVTYKEFIKTEKREIIPFDIKGKNLIFTSMNGVKSFFENKFSIEENRIFVVGSKTQKALTERGFKVEKTFPYASEMADFIRNNNFDEVFLHFCGNLSLDIVEQGNNYQKIIIYQTELLYPKLEQEYDALVFFSPSAVRSFAKNNSFKNLQCFAIGKTTENELKFYTDTIITSPKPNLEGILNEILQSRK